MHYQSKSHKDVVFMSTVYHDARVDQEAPKKKPGIVLFYITTKGAGDAVDKMAHTFSTKKAIKRWPMVLFYNIVDLATIAARAVWMLKFPKCSLAGKDARHPFLLRVGKQLAAEHIQ